MTIFRSLKIKCEAGADFLITQLFFDNEAYYRFVQKAQKGRNKSSHYSGHHTYY